MLRKIGDNNLVVESEDQTITTVSITGSTKYTGEKGSSAKLGDFQPGDQVSIDTSQDSKGNLKASRVRMSRAGTLEEHASASQAVDDLSRPITKPSESSRASSSPTSSSDTSSGDRPKLRRVAGSDDTSVSSSSASNSSDNDPDRPRLRRSSSSQDSSQAASQASNQSSSQVSNQPDGAPPARPQINPDSSATVAAPRRSAPPRASEPDDSDVPRLRRSAPADDGNTVASARPSLHADDSGGVTRLPSAPVEGAPAAGSRSAPRMASSGDPTIDQAREAAFSFSETLPNYVVKQYTTRYATQLARGGRTSWQAMDTVTADVIAENGEEKYKNILVNGKTPREDVEKTGSWSRGEFSSLLLDVLSPLTNADFHGKRATTIVNRPAFRYDLSVEQPNSHWHVESEGQSYLPAFTGAIWIDKESYRVLRIELSAQNLPRGFPLDTVESAVDYDFVAIGDGKYLLPTHSEALSCGRGTNGCTRNVIEFRNYRKFTADTSITFDQ
jgi:hypothetical protein